MSRQPSVFVPTQPSPNATSGSPVTGNKAILRRLGLAEDRAEMVKRIHRGFSVKVIEKLADELDLPQRTLLKVARIAPATLTRRRKSASGLLSVEESDRIYRIAEIYRMAVQLFEGDEDSARRWLVEPARALSGTSPIQHLDTEAGASEVRDLIGRLEHGIYT